MVGSPENNSEFWGREGSPRYSVFGGGRGLKRKIEKLTSDVYVCLRVCVCVCVCVCVAGAGSWLLRIWGEAGEKFPPSTPPLFKMEQPSAFVGRYGYRLEWV